MYTTVDQIEAVLRLYKDPFDSTKYTTKYTYTTSQESPIMSSPVVQTWQDQTWQEEFENLIREFYVSPLTMMFIYSAN